MIEIGHRDFGDHLMIEQMFRIFPDVRVHDDPHPLQFGSGDWIAVVTRSAGTLAGELTLPDGTVIPPTGMAFDLGLTTTAKWEGDRLVEECVFWDSALRAQQSGSQNPRAPPGSPGAPMRTREDSVGTTPELHISVQ